MAHASHALALAARTGNCVAAQVPQGLAAAAAGLRLRAYSQAAAATAGAPQAETAADYLYHVNVSGESHGMKTTLVSDVNIEASFEPPVAMGGTGSSQTPVQGLLSTLAACKTITIQMIAKEKNLSVSKVEFKAHATFDPRGFAGIIRDRDVYPGFLTTTLDIKVHTTADDATLQALGKEVERRCPIYRLIEKSGTDIRANYIKA